RRPGERRDPKPLAFVVAQHVGHPALLINCAVWVPAFAGTTITERAPNMAHSHGPLRIGVGGPVGSGKTALMDLLCKSMRERYDIAAITNDIYTKWDAEFLVRSGSLTPDRIV